MPEKQSPAVTWAQSMQPDATFGVGMGDEDFTKFLDLDSNFDFQQVSQDDGHTAIDTPMGRLAFGQNVVQDVSRPNATMMQQLEMSMGAGQIHNAFPNMGQQMQQQFPHYQMYQPVNMHQHYQPPTPISTEMQAAKYTNQVENAGQLIFERNQASFTPLVSPAQTALDNSWNVPDYVAADDFFSPLTSPAIEAQGLLGSTNATASPIDLNSELPSAAQTPAPQKRSRRKPGQQPSKASTRSVRQSPAMKPHKRRQFSLSSLPMDKIETMLERSSQAGGLAPHAAHAGPFASSEDSVSPEPLSEILMRPPPVPIGTTRSPTAAVLNQAEAVSMPATPAMLMRIPGKQSAGSNVESNAAEIRTEDIMEDIILPDAADGVSSKPLESHIKILPASGQTTPTIVTKTPKLSADSTPRTSAMKTANNSNESIDKTKKQEGRIGGRSSKKRQSISSAAISPALRPKISPSISPLVPATASGVPHLSAETSALYLASKSNYQNILDGTHLPGVSYPETLAENLSSKRTSHKIAEQGRRNRINLALKEIEGLLPASITQPVKKEKSNSSKEEGSPSEKSSLGAQGASKASTVEMAIIYIRSLQAELKETKDKLEAAEKSIAEGNVSSSSQASESGA